LAVRALALAALLAAAPDAPATRADPLDARREAHARRIVALGLDLRREILAGDVAAIAARVPAEGLRCGDRIVPRDRVLRDLRTPSSWVHRTLFGAGTASGPPPSMREFFRRAGEVAVEVTYEPDPEAGPLGRACLRYRAPKLVAPVLPLCFVERRGAFWLVESLYPCG
jgi:hypothetical protein